MKYLSYLCMAMLLSCDSSHELHTQRDMRVAEVHGRTTAILYPTDIVASYIFMRSIKQSGFHCDKTLSHCYTKDVVVERHTDSTGTIIFIYKNGL